MLADPAFREPEPVRMNEEVAFFFPAFRETAFGKMERHNEQAQIYRGVIKAWDVLVKTVAGIGHKALSWPLRRRPRPVQPRQRARVHTCHEEIRVRG